MKKLPKIAVSACLLGTPCRYNGEAKPNDAVIADSMAMMFHPFCPECEAGLATPRPPMRLMQTSSGIIVRSADGSDQTLLLDRYAKQLLKRIGSKEFDGILCKSRSPSCACTDAPRVDESGNIVGYGAGLVINLVKTTFPDFPIIDENQWQNLSLKEVFFEKIH